MHELGIDAVKNDTENSVSRNVLDTWNLNFELYWKKLLRNMVIILF